MSKSKGLGYILEDPNRVDVDEVDGDEVDVGES